MKTSQNLVANFTSGEEAKTDIFQEILDTADFDPKEACKFMWGGEKEYNTLVNSGQVLFDDPVLKSHPQRTEFSRQEITELGFRKLRRAIDLAKEGKVPTITRKSYGIFTFPLGGLIQSSAHHGMFEMVIKSLGNEEQVTKYVQEAIDYKIFGCYAQTEMGHGSDVRGLRTTSTYDPKEDCFIVNTPTIKDAKFWPGELGKAADHAVFQAQTIVKGKNVGVQSFICQIRDMKNMAALKGVEIGDIGPKYGFASKDNGYMIFKNFKISKSSLLSKFVEINDKGEFVQKGDPRVAYSTMMWIRIQLISATPGFVGKALMVASRYCYLRTQFKSLPDPMQERRIIDYQASLTKLVPSCAFTWVSKFFSYTCFEMYEDMQKEISEKNNFKSMKDLHSILCAIKAYYCEETLKQLKDLRELMGAQGYLQVNEMPEIIEMCSPNVTLEGDGCVMHQQTARDIFKSMGKIATGKEVSASYVYLQDFSNYIDETLEGDVKYLPNLLEILKANVIYQVMIVGEELRKDTGASFDEKWNKIHLSEIVKTSLLHAIFVTAKICLEGLDKHNFSDKLREKLELCCRIYVTESIIRYGDVALLKGFISAKQMFEIKVRILIVTSFLHFRYLIYFRTITMS